MTYTFFKDSQVLRGIVDSQLKMRQFDIREIKDKAEKAAGGSSDSLPDEKSATDVPLPATAASGKTTPPASTKIPQ
jgi:hypothetical protein